MHQCRNTNGSLTKRPLKLDMSNYIPLFYIDIITYPCHMFDARLADICYQKKLWQGYADNI